jgi:hypothetical protein
MASDSGIPGHLPHQLASWWEHGAGAAKIAWGTPGSFMRCVRLAEDEAHMTPERAKGFCAERYHAATGKWPGEHHHKGRSGMADDTNKPDDSNGDSAPRAEPLPFVRSFPLQDISIRAGDGRTVDAYATVFDTPAPIHDQDGDYIEVIDRRAFDRILPKLAPSGGRSSWRVGVLQPRDDPARHPVGDGLDADRRAAGNQG